nr:ABC-2 transporter permease [Maliibacterium massiliense]
MKHLFAKEWRLAMHPTAPLFLALSAMVLIPNYPYSVVFFYTCLGVFFLCLNGRENQDIYYSMLLPIRKRDIVKARLLNVVLIECAQVLLVGLCVLLKGVIQPDTVNLVGMDANTALLGVGLLELGLFNDVFFVRYYKNPDKVGLPFLLGTVALFVAMVLVEVSAHAVPFVRDVLDTPDPRFMLEKGLALLVGAAGFALLSLHAYRRAARSFEAWDL